MIGDTEDYTEEQQLNHGFDPVDSGQRPEAKYRVSDARR
jgi:hypothetical protein